MSTTKLPYILDADNAARANGWKVSGIGTLALYERPLAAIEIQYWPASGDVRRVVITRTGGGIDAVDPHDLIAILNSQEGLQR
jgi:hypothetical protein